MAGHRTISDEELRARLAPFYENNGEFLPPIIDATRSLLLAKLARLEHDNQELEIFSNKKSNNVNKFKAFEYKIMFYLKKKSSL